MLEARFFEREFELRFLKSHGGLFQDFFAEIMERAYPGDFQRVRPYGNLGDRKCDGYLASRHTVFQVYGPEHLSLRRLLKKIHEDFSGALQYWAGRMHCWVFVHNCRAGLPPPAVRAFDDLRHQPGAPLIEVWGYEELHRVLHQIHHGELMTLFAVRPYPVDVRPMPNLPQPDAVASYWTWLARDLEDPAPAPHLGSLRGMDLSIRLVTPDQARDLDAREERAVARYTDITTRWIHAEDDAGFAKGAWKGSTDLSQVLRSQRHLLIVGDSGSGKSTLLRRFAKHEARRLQSVTMAKARRQTPVIVELWRFGPDRQLVDIIATSVRRSGANISIDEILLAIERGYVVLLFDGLDEVPPNHRRECLAQIINLVDRYPRARVVLTSRPFPEPPDQFHRLDIAPLTDSEIAAALRTRFGSVREFRQRFPHYRPEDYVRLGLRPEVRQFLRRPLTLGLVVTLLGNNAELPESLYGVYDRFLSLLLDWEVRRGHLASSATFVFIMEEAAYAMLERNQTSLLTVDWPMVAGRAICSARALGLLDAPNAEDICRVILSTGLMRDLGGELQFCHRTFLEFLAARRILRTSTPVQADPVSLGTGAARFLCGAMQDASGLLEEHLLHCDDVEMMMSVLDEASQCHSIGSRFKTLYDAIAFGREIGVDITHSLLASEAEVFSEHVDELVQTAVAFKPKALSILKHAAVGVITAAQWEQSRSWFEQIIVGLEDYGWPGAALHRRLAEMGVFEAMDAFVDDGFDATANERVESLFSYVDAASKDDFAVASQHLHRIDTALRRWCSH